MLRYRDGTKVAAATPIHSNVDDEVSTLALINDDELSVVAAEVADLKQRLGLDATDMALRVEWSTLRCVFIVC
jgi:hypothetical protein